VLSPLKEGDVESSDANSILQMTSSRKSPPRGLFFGLGVTLFAVCGGLLFLGMGPSSSGSPPPTDVGAPQAESAAVRADSGALQAERNGRRAYRALKRHFGAAHGLLSKYSDDRGYAGAWAVAQAMDGALGLSRLPGGGVGQGEIRTQFRALQRYWDGEARTPGYDKGVRPPLGSGGFKFYDDNALVGLALVRSFQITHDPAMLSRAEQVFEFETSGWDRNPSHPFPGGVFWKQSPHTYDRNTVSTAGAAQLGLRLYLLTHDEDYLSWASRMYDWVQNTLRAPNGLYWDHVGLSGKIDRTQWSYNQGLMLGDSALLYEATGDHAYLDRARVIAENAVAYYRRGNRLANQRPIMNGIYFWNLLALDRLAPNPSYLRTAERYASYLSRHVDRRSALLRVNPRPFLLDQAALVQVNAYIALLRSGTALG
jgi:Glycosyl hydrolase family 76